MELIKNNSTANALQDLILEGKKILMKKSDDNYFIEIRFNHNDIDGTRKWRIILDDLEFHTSEILINISSRTESKFVEEFGGYQHHIVCDAREVIFKDNIANIW